MERADIKQLRLEDRLVAADFVVINVDAPGVHIRIVESGQPSPSDAFLSEDAARALFNWLGVYLHTR